MAYPPRERCPHIGKPAVSEMCIRDSQYTALENVMLAGELLAKEQPDYKANKKAIHAQLEAQAREDVYKRQGCSCSLRREE